METEIKKIELINSLFKRLEMSEKSLQKADEIKKIFERLKTNNNKPAILFKSRTLYEKELYQIESILQTLIFNISNLKFKHQKPHQNNTMGIFLFQLLLKTLKKHHAEIKGIIAEGYPVEQPNYARDTVSSSNEELMKFANRQLNKIQRHKDNTEKALRELFNSSNPSNPSQNTKKSFLSHNSIWLWYTHAESGNRHRKSSKPPYKLHSIGRML